MDKNKSIANVGVSIFFKFILLIGSVITRRFLIQWVGNDINGLNSLYLSVVGFLSVAELGVGSAITFCMYKPIVEKDNAKVAALYQFFIKTYTIIGIVIFSAGIAIMPLLPYLAKDYAGIDVSLYFTFFLMLLSVALSYMFGAKISLINAYKDNYITTTINSVGMILQYVLQIAVLVCTQSFAWYLACGILSVSLQWMATSIIAKKRHRDIVMHSKEKLDFDMKSQVLKNVKAMFMHKIGGILVNSADSMIISSFIGISMLGKYSNYTTIMNSMIAVIVLFFTPLTSIIGHVFITDKEKVKKYYSFFYSFNFVIGAVFFLGYYAVIDNLIAILFGDALEVTKVVSFTITLNYFIQFMRQSTLLFRDATGTFYHDRWKPFFEGILNAVLSIAFVIVFDNWWGGEFGVVGVLVATIITNVTICHLVEPYVLFKYAFNAPVKKHYLKNFFYIGSFTVALLFLDKCLLTFDNQFVELLVNGMISIAFSVVLFIVTVIFNPDFKRYLKKGIKTYIQNYR